MNLALDLAEEAAKNGEVPVGCVIIDKQNNEIIATGKNMMEKVKNPNAHAEMIAIEQACLTLNSKNLSNCNIYINLEPCTMCASAIANARIANLYYAASDTKQGAVENGVKFFTSSSCFHRPEIYSGICAEESQKIIKNFFHKIRC